MKNSYLHEYIKQQLIDCNHFLQKLFVMVA